ncbi:MAK10-like protein [Tanacetum coccineum]
MGEENPRRTVGDYSRPSHEGYQNTIKVPNGNDMVPLRSDTIRLVQNECSFHGLWSEDPNQHIKDFLKIVDSIDLNVETRERTRLRLFQFSLRDQASNWHERLPVNHYPKHGLISMTYSKKSFTMASIFGSKSKSSMIMSIRSQGEPLTKRPVNDLRDFAKPVKAIFMAHDVLSTSNQRMLELEDQIKRKEKLEEQMDEMLELVKKLMSSSMLEKVLVREESRQPPTKNVNAISLCKIEKDKGEKHEQILDKSMVELNNDINKPVETSNDPLRKATKESIWEERKMAELPEPYPVSFYLNHKINEMLIGGLIGNLRVTRKIGMEGNFVIPCNVGGTKDISAVVDEGSDVNVMPLSVYNRLTNEKLVETDVRLALASNSHIYPLGIAEDVLVEVTGFVYKVDFMILDFKEDVKKPLILRTPFFTTARAEIKFDSLRSGKSTVQFNISPDSFPRMEERNENKINTLSIVNGRVLEWDEKIKFHRMKYLEFEALKSKYSKSKALVRQDESSRGASENHGGVT